MGWRTKDTIEGGENLDSQGVSASKMTYIVSGGALNSTHSPSWAWFPGF